jgi:hypothetical protein
VLIVAVVDWHKRELPVGPPPDHKLAREQVVEEMRTAGWSMAKELDLLPYQYVLVFRWRQDSTRISQDRRSHRSRTYVEGSPQP